MVIMDGPVISKGAIVSSEVSFGDALIDIKEVLTIYVGDAILSVVPMYLFSSRFISMMPTTLERSEERRV